MFVNHLARTISGTQQVFIKYQATLVHMIFVAFAAKFLYIMTLITIELVWIEFGMFGPVWEER